MAKYNPVDLVLAIFKTELFKGDLVNLSSQSLAEAHAAIGKLETEAKERKDAIKTILAERAEKSGTPVGDKGAKEIPAGDFKVVRERKTASLPDANKLKAMLTEKGIPTKQAFDETIILELNPSKVQYLIDTGKLDKEAVEALRSTSFSVRVTVPKEVKALLEVGGAFGS
jgi:hypothetical protein